MPANLFAWAGSSSRLRQSIPGLPVVATSPSIRRNRLCENQSKIGYRRMNLRRSVPRPLPITRVTFQNCAWSVWALRCGKNRANPWTGRHARDTR